MEYIKSEKSWQDSIARGNVDEALTRIKEQITTNLMLVHNRFCKQKLKNPVDVYTYDLYGQTCDEAAKEQMSVFVNLVYKFIEENTGLDFDSPYSREEVLENFKGLEAVIKEEMSRI